jgi:NADH-quinone oxidoreductase subunit N
MTGTLAAAPLAILTGAALLILLAEVFFPRHGGRISGPGALFAFAAATVLAARSWGKGYSVFGGELVLDGPAVVFIGIICGAGMLVVLSGLEHVERRGIDRSAYHTLLLLACAGATVMVSSPDLLVVFLGLELLSISGYVLAGIDRTDPRSTESAVKSFMTGSLASAFLVFGLAFLYGAAGSLKIPAILSSLSAPSAARWAGPVGFGLVVVGLGFKIALVPFHMWAPDVYEGAPTPVTAFLAVGPKAAGFAVLLRLLGPLGSGDPGPGTARMALGAVAALTMIVASLAALRQKNVKRLLAYSSIAHSGTILLAVVAGDGPGLAFYLVVYLFMNIGAFGAVMALAGKDGERLDLDSFAGAGYGSPWIAALFSVFLLSLAGFPPTGGFLAKFFVFSTAVDRGLVGLVVVALLASLVSVYYYLRVIVIMYMKSPGPLQVDGPGPGSGHPALFLVIFLCFYAVLQLGIMPGNLLDVIRRAF